MNQVEQQDTEFLDELQRDFLESEKLVIKFGGSPPFIKDDKKKKVTYPQLGKWCDPALHISTHYSTSPKPAYTPPRTISYARMDAILTALGEIIARLEVDAA